MLSRLVRNVNGTRKFATPCYRPAPAIWVIPDSSRWNERRIEDMRRSVIAVQEKYDFNAWHEQFRIRLGFTSNKLEGNSFSEGDVMSFIKTGVTVGGKLLRDHAEIECHNNAISFVLNMVKAPISDVTTVEFVFQLHSICMPPPRAGSGDPIPGKIKTHPNMTACIPPGERVPVYRRFAEPEDARDHLFELLKWCEKNEREVPILPFISLMHYNFVRIHPFTDTNGRMSRLLTALFMLRRNFPPLIIDPTDRKMYMSALTYADFKQDLTPLFDFFGICVHKTYKDLIAVYGGNLAIKNFDLCFPG